MKHFLSVLSLLCCVSIAAWSQHLDTSDEFVSAVTKLIVSNYEKPSYRANFEQLKGSLTQIHMENETKGELSYRYQHNLSKQDFVDKCVQAYFDSQIAYDYAALISRYLKQYVSTADINCILSEINTGELKDALTRMELIGNDLQWPDDSYWDDLVSCVSQNRVPKLISENPCSSNYRLLFDDYYAISNTNLLMGAAINVNLFGEVDMSDPNTAAFVEKYKKYALATIETLMLNLCIDYNVTERELQLCVNYYSLDEYQNLSYGLTKATSDMAENTEETGSELWNRYSNWVSSVLIKGIPTNVRSQDNLEYAAPKIDSTTPSSTHSRNTKAYVTKTKPKTKLNRDPFIRIGLEAGLGISFTNDNSGYYDESATYSHYLGGLNFRLWRYYNSINVIAGIQAYGLSGKDVIYSIVWEEPFYSGVSLVVPISLHWNAIKCSNCSIYLGTSLKFNAFTQNSNDILGSFGAEIGTMGRHFNWKLQADWMMADIIVLGTGICWYF